MSGHYVAFEGIEGTGKSTISFRLADHLRSHGRRVVQVREPGGTPTGERIRRILLDPDGSVAPWSEALLFAAARAQLAVELVGPALREGSWVVSDRSVYSSLAYQGGGRKLGIDAVRAVNAPGLGEVWPELVILLRLDAATGLARQKDPDRIGREGIRFQAEVAAAFDRIGAEEPHRFIAVDAEQDIDAVWDAVRLIVEERWNISSET